MSVFISYSTNDSDFVEQLSMELVKHRVNVWLDKWEMKPGDSLIDKIQEGIAEASFLLVVLSNNSLDSEWCKRELKSAIMRELDEKKVIVIPILVEKCDIPLFLKDKLYADFTKKFDDGMSSLLRSLAGLISDMGRSTKPESIIDYGINWMLDEENLFIMNIDFVTWYIKEKKSLLLQIKIVGSRVASDRFLEQYRRGIDWLMKETLITFLYESETFKKMDILLRSDQRYFNKFYSRSPNDGVDFEIMVSGAMLGEDNGSDVLIHFEEYMQLLYGGAKARVMGNMKKNSI